MKRKRVIDCAGSSLVFEVERTEQLVPTWKGILPVYVTALVHGGMEGQLAAESELGRMAQAADQFNDLLDQTKRDADFNDPGYV